MGRDLRGELGGDGASGSASGGEAGGMGVTPAIGGLSASGGAGVGDRDVFITMETLKGAARRTTTVTSGSVAAGGAGAAGSGSAGAVLQAKL